MHASMHIEKESSRIADFEEVSRSHDLERANEEEKIASCSPVEQFEPIEEAE